MSNTDVNIRIGIYHFQIYQGLRFSFGPNAYHRGYPEGRFAIYNLFGLERLWR